MKQVSIMVILAVAICGARASDSIITYKECTEYNFDGPLDRTYLVKSQDSLRTQKPSSETIITFGMGVDDSRSTANEPKDVIVFHKYPSVKFETLVVLKDSKSQPLMPADIDYCCELSGKALFVIKLREDIADESNLEFYITGKTI